MKHRAYRVYITVAVFGILGFSASKPINAAAGDLDLTFGNGGKVITQVGNFRSDGNALAIQQDGKILVAGYSWNGTDSDFALVRYNNFGALDTTFGNGGIVITPIGIGNEVAMAVAIVLDGKIVAVGVDGDFPSGDFAVVRYYIDGSLDPSFDGDGIATTDIGASGYDVAQAVIVDHLDKVVVAGFGRAVGDRADFALVRYNNNGLPDPTFGGDGIVTTQVGNDISGAWSIAKAPPFFDGQAMHHDIVAGGFSWNGGEDFAVVRYKEHGALDTSFDGDGKVITPFGSSGDFINSIAVQPDGKVLAAGVSGNDIAIARYGANGSLDSSFDEDGKVITSIGNATDWADSVAPQSDGKIIVAGHTADTFFGNNNFAMVRYNPDGSLDGAYGNNGKVVVDFLGSSDFANGVVIDRLGRAVVAGDAGGDPDVDFALIRLSSHKVAPFDYDGDGKTDLSVFRPTDGRWYVMKSSGGIDVLWFGDDNSQIAPADFDGDGVTNPAIIDDYIDYEKNIVYALFVAGFSWFDLMPMNPGDKITPADYNGDQKADIAVFDNGTWHRRDSDGQTHTFQWGLSGDIASPADFNGDGAADMTVFRPSNGRWYTLNSGGASVSINEWGLDGDKPVPGDYSGDGKADFCVYRPSDQTWYRRDTETNQVHIITWGLPGDLPVPGDYDGDGKQDLAVFRPSNATWFIFGSTSGIYSQPFGLTGDIPTPNAFVY